MNKVWMLLLLAVVAVSLGGCPSSPGCTNTIAGNNNVAGCGGTGDDSDIETTNPTPVVVPPVVIVPEPEPEPEA